MAESPPKRVKTAIPGLDKLIGGGLLRNSVTILEGGPGSGKSIFCMQFLVKGIKKHNEPGIYISFEETPERILSDMEPFNWKLKELMAAGSLQIVHYEPEQINKVLVTGGGTIRDLIDTTKARRLVIDSLSAFSLMFSEDLEQRKGMFSLFEALRKWDCTSLVTVECEPEREGRSGLALEFEADAVILLYNQRRGNLRERSLEILKMRGTNHTNKILPLKIDKDGVTVYPKESVF